MNIEQMRASWLEAVAHGEADGFSRHFVPDILDELEKYENVVEAAKRARIKKTENAHRDRCVGEFDLDRALADPFEDTKAKCDDIDNSIAEKP